MKTPDKLHSLFQKYLEGKYSPAELQEFLDYLGSDAEQEEIRQLLEKELSEEIKPTNAERLHEMIGQLDQGIYNGLEQRRNEVRTKALQLRSNRLFRLRIGAAAAILLIIGSALFFYTSYYGGRHPEGGSATRDLLANTIKPGTNKAILTLANGQQITLTDVANGTIANQSGIKITKTANGQVIYTMLSLSPSGRTDQREFNETKNNNKTELNAEGSEGKEKLTNTISTPRGGQYQIHLPDGTHVWLNAASTLKYPITFTGSPDRKVSLTGEAYFEVAKDKTHPFKVMSANQEVQVLGTHFNINTYPDEPTTRTTLLEGSVAVRHLDGSAAKRDLSFRRDDVVLKPNQQAILTQNNQITIKQVDVNEIIDWKNSEFVFDSQTIEQVMRKVSRWYDVTVTYQDGVNTKQTFSGQVSRTQHISEILKGLEATGSVHFEIKGKTVIVKK